MRENHAVADRPQKLRVVDIVMAAAAGHSAGNSAHSGDSLQRTCPNFPFLRKWPPVPGSGTIRTVAHAQHLRGRTSAATRSPSRHSARSGVRRPSPAARVGATSGIHTALQRSSIFMTPITAALATRRRADQGLRAEPFCVGDGDEPSGRGSCHRRRRLEDAVRRSLPL